MDKKGKQQEKGKSDSIDIPLKILQNRDVAILESIVAYLKDEKEMKYSKIARLLNRDQRTIWTVYNRVKIKRKVQNKKMKNKNNKE